LLEIACFGVPATLVTLESRGYTYAIVMPSTKGRTANPPLPYVLSPLRSALCVVGTGERAQ
jgi:hypothetical protein